MINQIMSIDGGLVTIKKLFLSGINYYVNVPEDLQPYINKKKKEKEPWKLAERIVLSLLDNPNYETKILTLLQTIQFSINNNTFIENSFNIVDNIFELISNILQNPTFLNSFKKDNALVTIYFTIIFLLSCARVEIRRILKHDKTIVQMAILCNRLLLNQQIYQFVKPCINSCKKSCKKYLSQMFSCKKSRAEIHSSDKSDTKSDTKYGETLELREVNLDEDGV